MAAIHSAVGSTVNRRGFLKLLIVVAALLSLGCESEEARAEKTERYAQADAEQFDKWAAVWTEERIDAFCAEIDSMPGAYEVAHQIRWNNRFERLPMILGCLYERTK